jgi:hypothetical protein
MSADGNTAIVGGCYDNTSVGAAWVYTRSAGIWTQQGNKLVGTGATAGGAYQGGSVSISSDGNTAMVGGGADSSGIGAVWVFTRTAGVWSQQGNKLVGTGSIAGNGGVGQGNAVSLSSDGNTAIVGGDGDNTQVGALWVFTRSGGVWSQRGNKLIGTGAVGTALQASHVSISSDGSTAIVGGTNDCNSIGAAWVFVPATATAIPEYRKKGSLLAYPNPNTGTFTIQSFEEGEYSIMNQLGQTIRQFRLTDSNDFTIHMDGLSSGLYFIVGFNNTQVTSRKIVVTK